MPHQKHRKLGLEPTQVRYTGDWSADSKLSCIQNGYWKDPFFIYFNHPVDPTKIPKRTALICRGYYVRFKLCDYYLKRILDAFRGLEIQIVSLGCGMDTTYFRIMSDKYNCNIHKYFELDFPSVIQHKRNTISDHEALRDSAKDKLVLVEYDLRNLTTLHETLANSGFDFALPSLFYSECVVNYLKPSESEAILNWITSNAHNCVWLAYEQCYAHDPFGQIMVQHFQKNGCPILSIEENSDMEAQRTQLKRTGFQDSLVLNVWDTFVKLYGPDEFLNITGNQQFDEYESFIVTCLHYSVRLGCNGSRIPLSLSEFSQPITRIPVIPPHLVLRLDMQSTFSTHSSIVVNDKIWILGGTNKSNTRMSDAIELSLSMDANSFNIVENQVTLSKFCEDLDRVHTAATFIKPLNSIFAFGGRKSPRTPSSGILSCIKLDDNNTILSVTKIDSEISSKPAPRWRHTLTSFARENGTSCLFLFGGKTEPEVFGDCWIFDCVDNNWMLNDDIVKPTARHSHSICAAEDRNSIFIIGGMYSEANINEDSLWEYRYNHPKDNWIKHFDLYQHCQKVGTAAVWYKGELLILGGYGNDSMFKLEHFLVRINVETHEIKHYELNLPSPTVFLPFGFTAHLVHQNNCDFIVVLGGGGNCFSFGTHYNDKCLVIKVSSLD